MSSTMTPEDVQECRMQLESFRNKPRHPMFTDFAMANLVKALDTIATLERERDMWKTLKQDLSHAELREQLQILRDQTVELVKDRAKAEKRAREAEDTLRELATAFPHHVDKKNVASYVHELCRELVAARPVVDAAVKWTQADAMHEVADAVAGLNAAVSAYLASPGPRPDASGAGEAKDGGKDGVA